MALTDSPPKPPSGRWRLFAIGIFIIAVVISLIIFRGQLSDLEGYVIDKAPQWATWVQANVLIFVPIFVVAYTAITLFGLPLSLVMSLGGAIVSSLAFGFWLGTALSTFMVWTSVMIGSWGLFEFVRRVGSESYSSLAGPYMERFQKGFEQDQFLYMLSSRFTPIPPSIMTVVPALLGARRSAFLFAAGIGFLPGVVVYASLGAKLGELLIMRSEGESISFSEVTTFANLWPLYALLALSFVPLIIRRINS